MPMTSVTLSDTIKTMYEKRLLSRAVPRFLHGKWGMIARLNKVGSYELRKFSGLTAISSTLSEGVTPSEGAAPTLSTITMTPAWYGSWVSYTDQLDLQNFDPTISETVSILGEQAGLSFDTLVRNSLTDGATKDYSGVATTRVGTTDLIDYADFIGVVATLEVNNAMPSEGELFPVVLHPYSFAELMQNADFISLFTREGGEAIRYGRMGTILRCAVYVSSNARTYDNAGAASKDVFSALFIGRESYGLAGMAGLQPNYVQDPGGEHGSNTGRTVNPVSIIVKDLGQTGLDPLDQRGTIGWKATHAHAILNSSWVVDLEHTTSYTV